MGEMTMAQYKEIRFHNTMVATDFQQKFDIGGKTNGRFVGRGS